MSYIRELLFFPNQTKKKRKKLLIIFFLFFFNFQILNTQTHMHAHRRMSYLINIIIISHIKHYHQIYTWNVVVVIPFFRVPHPHHQQPCDSVNSQEIYKKKHKYFFPLSLSLSLQSCIQLCTLFLLNIIIIINDNDKPYYHTNHQSQRKNFYFFF